MKEEGLITNNDVLRSELQLSNDRISLKRTENSIILASQQLDILLGLDEQLLIVPDTSALRPTLLDETFETCLMKAYDADPSVRLARQRVALAENEVKIACSDYFPTISLYAGNTLARPISRTMADMFCYFIYFAILYFGVSPSARYEMFIMPMILRGFGMIVLFIAFGLYVVEDLEPKLMLSNTFFLINSRSVLAPIIAISFYSNVQYRLQLEYVQSLSASVTSSDPLAAERYGQALQGAISQGHGFDQATQMAVSSLDSTLQMQGLLLSVKDIFGTMMAAALVVAVVSAFIPFHKAIRVKVVKTGEDMV